MDRRSFLSQSSLLGAAALLPATSQAMPNQPQAPKYKMGYQLFSVRDDMAKAPKATLTALAKMGYQDFEIYGYDPEADTIYGYKPADFKKILADQGLTATSGHFGFSPFLDQSPDALKKFVDQCIQCAQVIGMPYITWPWMAPEQRNLATFKRLPAILNRIGEQVTKAGLGFAYHNHGFEFTNHDGEIGYDLIMNETDPELVKLQIDMYWVMHSAKRSPKALVEAQPGRFVMWHIKDMDALTRDYTELGNGSINYLNVLPDPVASGLEYVYIEQGGNFAKSAMQSAADSAVYYKKHLQQLL
ncbi:MAG: sugar phosphate isomerase/epimerase [Bacteroidota bacterium]